MSTKTTTAAGIPVVPSYREWLAGRSTTTPLYEEHRAMEKERDDKAAAVLAEMLAALVDGLGEGWTLRPEDPEAGYGARNSGQLNGPNGARLFVRWDGYDVFERLAVSASYPQGTREAYYNAPSAPSITVRADRGAAVLVREVSRRVLAAYLPELAKAQEKIAERQTDAERTAATAAELAALLGGTVRQDEGNPRASVHWYHAGEDYSSTTYGDATVQGDSVTLDRVSLTLDQFRRVAAILAESRTA